MVRSPFDGLKIPRDLVCEFFAFFARFEFALKEHGYGHAKRGRYAAPDWNRFAADSAGWLTVDPGSPLAEAIAFLVGQPPQVQRWPGLHWEAEALRGQHNTERALHAACRVRNNLFHGGKHPPHSNPGCDEALVHAALCLLHHCIDQEPRGLRWIFEEP